MAYQMRYEGDSHHLLPLIAGLLVDDTIGGEWHVEVTTHGAERTVEGVVVAAQPYGHGTPGTITVTPWNYDTHAPTGEPDVTISAEDIEELVIP